MKLNISTLLGFFTCLLASSVLLTDMFLSTKEVYHFELKDWHVFSGYALGVALVVLPEEKIIQLTERIIKNKTK